MCLLREVDSVLGAEPLLGVLICGIAVIIIYADVTDAGRLGSVVLMRVYNVENNKTVP